VSDKRDLDQSFLKEVVIERYSEVLLVKGPTQVRPHHKNSRISDSQKKISKQLQDRLLNTRYYIILPIRFLKYTAKNTASHIAIEPKIHRLI
jgi:hypothetical protein